MSHAASGPAYHTSCYTQTSWFNNMDDELSYTLASNQVLAGAYSYHRLVSGPS